MRRLPWLAICLLSLAVACATTPTTPKSVKPVASDDLVTKAKPKLEKYLQRVLKGKEIHGAKLEGVTLKEAVLFSEGHMNETWKIVVEADSKLYDFALKIFADGARADANAAQYRAALAHEWPVPMEFVRGPTLPYTERPSLLMEYITGGTLQTRIKRQFDKDDKLDSDAIVAAYGAIGELLGEVHKKNLRERKEGDRSGKKAMAEMLATCKQEGWCGKGAQGRLEKLASEMDKGKVTFVHGDLYESQVVLRADGKVAAFLDLDQAGYSDPAEDVGALLAHIVLFNPWTRDIMWDVPDPRKEETQGAAEALLREYKATSGLADDWPHFLGRVRAYMWLRLDHILKKLRGNPHAKDLMEELEVQKRGLATTDPFEDYELNP